jgi:pilus assembly protein CpaB
VKARPTLPRALDALVRVLRWHRRWIAAAAAFVAVFAGIGVLQPHRTPTLTVVAAAHDLPGGTTLAASDLLRLELPTDAAPDGVVPDAASLVGRVVNAPVTARTPITRATVSTGSELARPGFVVVAVPLANEALVGLLTAGTHLDLIGAGKAGVVASNVRVVAAPSAQGGSILSSASRALLVEVTPETAAALAGALDAGGITIAVR